MFPLLWATLFNNCVIHQSAQSSTVTCINYRVWIGLSFNTNEVPVCFSMHSCWKTGLKDWAGALFSGFNTVLAAIRPYSIPMSAMLDGSSNWATLDNGDTGPSISNKREKQCDSKSPGGEDGRLIWSTLSFFLLQSSAHTHILFRIHLPYAFWESLTLLHYFESYTGYRNLLYFAIQQFRVKM